VTAAPRIGNALYRPVRVMTCPAPIDVVKMPATIGSRASPDSVGVMPWTTWKYTGR
jgi:hypothetical protein